MTVRELLKQIAPALPTHEVVTRTNAPTKLCVDIEHCHHFHSLGRLIKRELDGDEYNLLRPFEHSFYKEGDKMWSVLDDFEVYRWKLIRPNDDVYEWILEIETNQTVRR